ncbi:MAG: CinA family protein [Porticoccaceae bacterium]
MKSLTSLATPTADALIARSQTLAVCESSAGGLISAALVSYPGASAYFLGGTVVYTLSARDKLIDVNDEDMAGIRPASEAYALLCARRIRAKLGSDWALAETGASGPSGNPYGDAPGHACFAVSGPIERAMTIATGRDNREDNMWIYAQQALNLLMECLAEQA